MKNVNFRSPGKASDVQSGRETPDNQMRYGATDNSGKLFGSKGLVPVSLAQSSIGGRMRSAKKQDTDSGLPMYFPNKTAKCTNMNL